MIEALVRINVAKFVSEDIPLFYAILSDLFPGVEIPKIQNNILEFTIKE